VKISSPIGEFDYRVEGVAFRDGQLKVAGRLGQWETTTIVERSELLRLAVPLVAVICAICIVTRRPRRV
jgi:hypothetical protein